MTKARLLNIKATKESRREEMSDKDQFVSDEQEADDLVPSWEMPEDEEMSFDE